MPSGHSFSVIAPSLEKKMFQFKLSMKVCSKYINTFIGIFQYIKMVIKVNWQNKTSFAESNVTATGYHKWERERERKIAISLPASIIFITLLWIGKETIWLWTLWWVLYFFVVISCCWCWSWFLCSFGTIVPVWFSMRKVCASCCILSVLLWCNQTCK